MDREREIVRGVKDGQEQTTETVWQFLALLRRFLFPSAPSPAWHLPLTIARNLSLASAFALLFYCQFVALPLFVVVSIADIKRKMAMPAPKYDLILTARTHTHTHKHSNTLSCVTALAYYAYALWQGWRKRGASTLSGKNNNEIQVPQQQQLLQLQQQQQRTELAEPSANAMTFQVDAATRCNSLVLDRKTS